MTNFQTETATESSRLRGCVMCDTLSVILCVAPLYTLKTPFTSLDRGMNGVQRYSARHLRLKDEICNGRAAAAHVTPAVGK